MALCRWDGRAIESYCEVLSGQWYVSISLVGWFGGLYHGWSDMNS